jgi:competence protein ComEC
MGGLSDKFHSAPFVRLLIPFILGIILAEWLLPIKSWLYFSFPTGCTILLFFFRKSNYKYDFLTGLLLFVIFMWLGFSIAQIRRYVPQELSGRQYYAILDEFPLEKDKTYRALIRLVDPKIKVLAYFEKSDELSTVQPGTPLFFKGCPEMIENHGNPFEFDYKAYSARQRIGHRIYLKGDAYHFLRDYKILSLQNRALILREKLLKRLAENGVKGETYHVISAITLGARDNLDPETTESFARTGTLHVLAVSGGNVAVIFFLLSFLFGFLKKYKAGVAIHTLIILSGIWGYALITGLSPSVLRAATMFSFIVIGTISSSKPNIYNSLAASAFILMCFNPSLLFDAGFQLSYAAVIAIVFLQPIFYKYFSSRFRIIDHAGLLFSVSLAAQIGTLPFSLYYFHQFPSYFWLSNMVVVPLVSILIYFTLFVIITVPMVSFLGIMAAHFLNWIGNQMLVFLQFVENLPFAVVENLYPSAYQLILISLAIIFAVVFVINKKGAVALVTLSIIALLLLMNNLSLYTMLSRKEIVVFNIPGKTLIAFTTGRETTWLTSENSNAGLNYFIQPYKGFRKIIHQNDIVFTDTINQFKSNLLANNNFMNFQGLKIYLHKSNRLNPDSIRHIPKPDIVFATEKRNIVQSDAQMNYPQAIYINTLSPVTFRNEMLLYDKSLIRNKHEGNEETGAVIITIQKFTDDNTIKLRTTYFKNRGIILDHSIQ